MNKLREMADRLIEEEKLLPPEGTLVIGLSGGADSVALAHYLQQKVGKERLLCVHVNHGLRGEEAERDEAFVQDFCQKEALSLRVFHVDVKSEAKKNGEGEEACGRRMRYACFTSCMTGENDRIAVAHTLSDQMETMLLHMVRGCSPGTLCGMRPKRGRIIRPLLRVERGDIEAYCRDEGLSYCTDSTNLAPLYARNRIRLQVTPVLCALNPRAPEAFDRLSRQLIAQDELLRQMAEEALKKAREPFGYAVEALQTLPEALLLRCLTRMHGEKDAVMPEERHVRWAAACVKEGKGSVPFPGGWCFCCDGGVARFYRPQKTEPFSVPLTGNRFFLPDGRCFRLTVHEKKFHNLLFNNGFDYDTIAEDLILRTRQPGDRFCPVGKTEKPLRQWLAEKGIPREERDRLAVLVCGTQIVWVQGLGPNQAFRITAATQTAGTIEWVAQT